MRNVPVFTSASRSVAFVLLALVLPFRHDTLAQSPDVPEDSAESERVEVRLMLLDVVVVDRDGRTVRDLTLDDFEVRHGDGWKTPDTLDQSCPGGAADEPEAVRRPGQRRVNAVPGFQRKIVLLFDYMHVQTLDDRFRMLEAAQAMIDQDPSSSDEIMVASLAGGLRVELPFTSDRRSVSDKLREMRHDVTLYGRTFTHSHEVGFFGGLKGLMTVLAQLPGPKAAVLYSAPHADSFEYDLEHAQVAALAAAARTSLYPIRASGLVAGDSVGSSTNLDRLAVETGGRHTQRTNDLTLAFARATRDLGCRYTLGVYVDATVEDTPSPIAVRTRRDDLTAHAPGSHLFLSDSARLEGKIFSSFMSPEMFGNRGILRAHAFPLRPAGTRRWEAVLLVNFPVEFDESDGNEQIRDFGAVLRGALQFEHKFNRRMTLRLKQDSVERQRRVTFVQFIDIESGSFSLTASIFDPGTEMTDSARTKLEVPELPGKGLALVTPVLGRPAGRNVVVSGNLGRKDKPKDDRIGTSSSFEPLLVQETDRTEVLLALTRACLIGKRRSLAPGSSIDRSVLQGESDDLGRLEEEPVELEPAGAVRCDTLLDDLPMAFFDPGDYVFEALVQSARQNLRKEVPFAVED